MLRPSYKTLAWLPQDILSRLLAIDVQAGKFRTIPAMKYRPAVYSADKLCPFLWPLGQSTIVAKRYHATWELTPAVFRLVPVRLKWLYWAIFDPAFPQGLHYQYRWHIRILEQQYAASTVLTLFKAMSHVPPPPPLNAPIGGITAPAETSHVAPIGATIASVPGLDSYSISGLIRDARWRAVVQGRTS